MADTIPTETSKGGLPVISFVSAEDFYLWLRQNHAEAPGVWIRMYKKHTGRPTVGWEEAVEVALCFGWIDSIRNSYDADSFIQRFTPRRPRGLWSKKNCQTVGRLIADGRMQPAGLAEVERAKADGRWDKAYDSPKDMQTPQDFLDRLELHPKAKETFAMLNKTSRYLIAFRLHNAKRPETRTRRLEDFIAKLERGEPLS